MDYDTRSVAAALSSPRRRAGNSKMMFTRHRGISPIIATVLIIAVTLIAAVAIGGFVFGIFGSSSNSAQVSVTSQNLIAADFQPVNALVALNCNVAAQAGSTLTLTNTGTAAATVTGVTITYAGAVNSFTMNTSCTVAAAGNAGANSNGSPIIIGFTAANWLSMSPTSGQTYTGTVTMSSGAILIFQGTFN